MSFENGETAKLEADETAMADWNEKTDTMEISKTHAYLPTAATSWSSWRPRNVYWRPWKIMHYML